VVQVPVGEDDITAVKDIQPHPAGIFEECTGIAEVEEDFSAPGLDEGRKSRFRQEIAVDKGGTVDKDPEPHGLSLVLLLSLPDDPYRGFDDCQELFHCKFL